MENILNLLTSGLGSQIINGISEKTNTSVEQTSSVVSSAIPALLGALQNNASTEEGAQGILNAVTSKHDGSILDNISGFLGNGGNEQEGKGILGNIFGNQLGDIQNGISQKTGVSASSVGSILSLLAPIIMGYLGKQAQSSNISDGGGISNLLSSLLGGNSGSSILSSILDQNGDGKLGLDDLAGLVSGNKSSKGNGLLGNLLGKFLGK
ncbi:DUF937 domain-containing protein [Apibacter muscae]|uniref:DUF937 domain-containing protein n=1 Tax=Apibacter muscae TaxID=2509004 RepID=A0A563D7J7_9FLAO|nr:DUF937 domain-containing protein [Apibacter muscae]TWP26175.1 DUF937 domain-containing protein [Apibacter muscae]TWP28019.1 DUF937 domain-containing protein [Apibacter muscae]